MVVRDRAVLGAGHASKEVNDLRGAEDDGQLQRPLGHRDVVVVPRPAQSDLVEEAQCGGDHAQAAGGELALLDQMDLVGPNLLGAERLRRAVEVPGEGADLLDVSQLGVEGEIANAHVLEHPLAQRCHGGAPVQWNEGGAEISQHAHPHAKGARELRLRRGRRSVRWWGANTASAV